MTSAAIKVGVAYYIGYYYILSKSMIKVFINWSMFHRIISSWSFVLRYLDYAIHESSYGRDPTSCWTGISISKNIFFVIMRPF